MINKYVQINPRVCNGKPVIAGTRIQVTVILDEMIEAGSIEKVITLFPELSAEQVIGALKYCHSVIEHTDFESLAA